MAQEIKIIHTGDLHLGMTFKSLGDKSKLHRRDCQDIFSDIVNLCIKEKVDSLCFGESDCNYEGTLWASLALSSLGEDIKSYLPYLITIADEENNKDFLSEAFLYYLTGNIGFNNQLFTEQLNNKWLVSLNNKYYGAA